MASRFKDFDVVDSLNDKLCSDPKDHVYGLVSLFDDPDAYPIDYTLSVPEFFADFTAHCLPRTDFALISSALSTCSSTP